MTQQAIVHSEVAVRESLLPGLVGLNKIGIVHAECGRQPSEPEFFATTEDALPRLEELIRTRKVDNVWLALQDDVDSSLSEHVHNILNQERKMAGGTHYATGARVHDYNLGGLV